MGVEELVRTFDYKERPEIFKYYPQYYHKIDKVRFIHAPPLQSISADIAQDGRPVYIEQLGNVDLAAMAKITSQERMLQNLVCEYEKMADPRLPACSRKSGYLLETSCSIMDLKGVGISKASSVYGYLQAVSTLSQNYYPERLGKMYIINAPWGFSGVWSFVKRFLDPVTVAKIHILGSGYQKELLAQVPAENLPKQFGGTCACPGGCELSDAGPWQDPQWVKPPKWATKKEDKDAIDNTKLPEPTAVGAQQPLTGAGPEGVEPAAATAQNPNTANSA